MARFWEGSRADEVEPPAPPVPDDLITRVRKQAKALVPEDRFIDLSLDDYRSVVKGILADYKGIPYATSTMMDIYLSDKGCRIDDHVYARPIDTAPPADPALVAEVHALVRSAEAMLKRLG